MALSLLTPAVLAAAAAAAAIAFAPAAAAEDRDEASKPGPKRGTTTSQTESWNSAPKGWTNEAQWARPGASNPFGSLPKPPIFAMD